MLDDGDDDEGDDDDYKCGIMMISGDDYDQYSTAFRYSLYNQRRSIDIPFMKLTHNSTYFD